MLFLRLFDEPVQDPDNPLADRPEVALVLALLAVLDHREVPEFLVLPALI